MVKNISMSSLFSAAILVGSSATADLNTDDFLEYLTTSEESKGIALVYINAAFSAFQVANLELEDRGQPPIFCMPETLRVTEQEMAGWVEEELILVQIPKGSDVPVTIALREVLMTRFPCSVR